MRIVYCIPSVFNSGGMERILAVKANYLVKKGYDIYIVTTDQKNRTSFFEYLPQIKFVDLDINYSDNRDRHTPAWFIRRISKGSLHKKRLQDLLLEIKPDITISMFQHESSFLYKLKDGSVKLIESHFCRYVREMSFSSNLWSKIISRYRIMADARLVCKYDRFITLTNEDRLDWPKSNNIVVIPNPVTIVSNGVSTLESKRVIAVGRISYQKGFDRLIKAWNIVERQTEGWRLSIIGSAENEFYTNEVKDLIKLYNLKNIDLFSPTGSIIEEYLKSSFLVMSSRYEGLPLVLLEAMSCGLPCVSFACKCGPRDIITHGKDGLLVEDGDILQLANAMMELMENTDKLKQMGINAENKAKQYGLRFIMEKWIELFQSCVNKKLEK